jgi:biotin transport system substrate-specific component
MINTNVMNYKKSLLSRVYNSALVLGTSWLIAAGAWISIHLPFSPVPVTLQTLVVLLAGLLLGKNLAAASVLAYLVQGAAGLPFFAGGRSGLAALLGPTGGYLFGFLAAAYVVGLLSELQFRSTMVRAAVCLLTGSIVIYIFGLAWLARFIPESQVLALGLYPFLAGDLLKLLVGISLVRGGSTALAWLVPGQERH